MKALLRSRGKGFKREEFYSICSMHGIPKDDCMLCNSGSWVNVWHQRFSSALFHIAPSIWRWLVNR